MGKAAFFKDLGFFSKIIVFQLYRHALSLHKGIYLKSVALLYIQVITFYYTTNRKIYPITDNGILKSKDQTSGLKQTNK